VSEIVEGTILNEEQAKFLRERGVGAQAGMIMKYEMIHGSHYGMHWTVGIPGDVGSELVYACHVRAWNEREEES
jgi:hypothetical protein